MALRVLYNGTSTSRGSVKLDKPYWSTTRRDECPLKGRRWRRRAPILPFLGYAPRSAVPDIKATPINRIHRLNYSWIGNERIGISGTGKAGIRAESRLIAIFIRQTVFYPSFHRFVLVWFKNFDILGWKHHILTGYRVLKRDIMLVSIYAIGCNPIYISRFGCSFFLCILEHSGTEFS